jgi:hypothetical protein
MSHGTHYRTLIDRGRKAGLNTRDLYSAMASSRLEGADSVLGQADSNGFVSSLTQEGNRVYRQVGGAQRS